MHSYAYRLLSESPAKKTAKKLVGTVGLMGFDLKLSRAQEIVARLMGYEDWAELIRLTKTAPERGAPDQMLPPRVATVRQERQRALLADEFDIDDFAATGLLEALAPTGEAHASHWPSIEKLGLRLTDADTAWLQESMELVRAFDAAVRPLFALAPPTTADASKKMDLVRVRVERTASGVRRRRVIRNTTPADIVEWVAHSFPNDIPLSGEKLAKVSERADKACQLFAELDRRIRDLGAAPMLAPIDWTFLMLFRCSVHGNRSHYTAINPEPWLHIGFDLPHFCFNPENEWNASRALSLQLALRREFLDAGWTGEGPEWRVTFRDGNSAKEEVVVPAATVGAAFAWIAAARAALRLAKRQNVGIISLISVNGPDGPGDPEIALARAKDEAIIRRCKLLGPDRLRVRGRRKAT